MESSLTAIAASVIAAWFYLFATDQLPNKPCGLTNNDRKELSEFIDHGFKTTRHEFLIKIPNDR